MFIRNYLIALVLLVAPLSSLAFDKDCRPLVISNHSTAVWSIQYDYPRPTTTSLPDVLQSGWHSIQPGEIMLIDVAQLNDGVVIIKDITGHQIGFRYYAYPGCPYIEHDGNTIDVWLNDPNNGDITLADDDWHRYDVYLRLRWLASAMMR